MTRKNFWFISLLAILILSIGVPDTLFAQASNGYYSGDGIEGSVSEGDTQASLSGLIDWWKTNSGIEMGSHDARDGQCKKVVGLRFDFASNWDEVGEYIIEGEETDDAHIFYCALDVSGQKITLNERPDPNSVTDIYWSFQATAFYGCDTPALSLTPSPASIDVGEDSTVDIQIDCFDAGGVGGMTVNLYLSEGSPGSLDQHEVITDGSGHASVTFTSDGEGTAIVNAQVMSCQGEDSMELLEGVCTINVGGRKLQVDLIYQSHLEQAVTFDMSFVHRMEIDIETSDDGQVTGNGTGKTSFDFEYHNEEVHTENWSDSGFTECEAEGTFDGETYMINIDTTGSISYEHVVEVPGHEPIRFPVDADIDWDQLLAEPIVIGASDDSTFSASGSFPWGLNYTILARWVSDNDSESGE